jgi:hypothetical protein
MVLRVFIYVWKNEIYWMGKLPVPLQLNAFELGKPRNPIWKFRGQAMHGFGFQNSSMSMPAAPAVFATKAVRLLKRKFREEAQFDRNIQLT